MTWVQSWQQHVQARGRDADSLALLQVAVQYAADMRQGCSSSPCSGQLIVQLVLGVPGLLEGLLPPGCLLLCTMQPSAAALLQGQDAGGLQASRQHSKRPNDSSHCSIKQSRPPSLDSMAALLYMKGASLVKEPCPNCMAASSSQHPGTDLHRAASSPGRPHGT